MLFFLLVSPRVLFGKRIFICFFCLQLLGVWTVEICFKSSHALFFFFFFSFKPQVPKVVEKVFFTTALPVAGNTGKHVQHRTFFSLFTCLQQCYLNQNLWWFDCLQNSWRKSFNFSNLPEVLSAISRLMALCWDLSCSIFSNNL